MSPEDEARLGELLAEMGKDPKGFFPQGAWDPLQKAFALPYLELLIVRRSWRSWFRRQILLSYRSDEFWKGWHIPGGLWRTRHSLVDGVASLAKKELGPDARLKILVKGGWEKWLDHPYGYPISHLVICSSGSVVESDTLKWFSAPPDNMIADGGHHRRFIEQAFAQTRWRLLI